MILTGPHRSICVGAPVKPLRPPTDTPFSLASPAVIIHMNCIVLTQHRVYYLPLAMLALATSVARPNLVSLGTCFGKFSKTGKFKLGITCLDWLAKYAKYKVRL